MSLVGYIWNKWGSVPSSPGKLARPLPVCLVKSHLGAFSSPSVHWCWGTLPLHNSAQKYECSALIFQFITYQLLFALIYQVLEAKYLPLDLFFFFHCWLACLIQYSWTLQAGYPSYSLFYIPKHAHLVTFPESETAWSCWNASVCYGAAVRQHGEFVSHGQLCLNPEVPLAICGRQILLGFHCFSGIKLFLYLIKFTRLT